MLLGRIKDLIHQTNRAKRPCFALSDESLHAYLLWAFDRNYILTAGNVDGVAIAYPLPWPCDGINLSQLVPYEKYLEPNAERGKELVVMDWVAKTPEARKMLVKAFKERYPDWDKVQKWGLIKGSIRLLPNN
jgi:hypothetical protein